jgi:hypothetical protein
MSATRLRVAFACLLVAGTTLTAPPVAAQASASRSAPVELSLDRARVSMRLGNSVTFSSTIVNSGRTRASGLVAHLNIVSLTRGVYVDPEDWSEQRTRYLPPLDAGGSATIRWKVKAVNRGRFAVYVVVFGDEGPRAALGGGAVSPALDVRVAERRTLNSGGVVPLALGVPALVALLGLAVRLRRRSP